MICGGPPGTEQSLVQVCWMCGAAGEMGCCVVGNMSGRRSSLQRVVVNFDLSFVGVIFYLS